MNRRYLKNNAKAILKNHYWHILLQIFIVEILSLSFISFNSTTDGYYTEYTIDIFAISIPVQLTPLMGAVIAIAGIAMIIFSIFFASVLRYGLHNHLKYKRNDMGEQFDIFEGFRSNYMKIVKLNLRASIEVILWTLLFIIPGIIKTYQYQYINEIYEEHPTWTTKQVLQESKRVTYGYKGELFVLDLSFIGWHILAGILSAFTFGLGLYLVHPYVRMTNVEAYYFLKELANPEESIHNEYFE